MRANLPINERRPDPTPSEIRAMCLEIQRTWSERERMARARGWLVVSQGARLPESLVVRIHKLRAEGWSIREIASELEIADSTVWRYAGREAQRLPHANEPG